MNSKESNLNRNQGNISKVNLPYKILVGSHHKAGTVWLQSIFKKICQDYYLNFFNGKKEELPASFDVFLQFHSRFDLGSLVSDYRGVHIIRDPRDVIVSGCFYHQKAQEKWLHIPNKEYNGLTYQQKINSFNNLNDKILFEMENSGQRNIKNILNWDFNNSRFIEIKYEDLIIDKELKLFQEIFTFLGFPENTISHLLEISFNKSLFSGNVNNKGHIRSGETNQWQMFFKDKHKEKFKEMFGDGLVCLGYEVDNNW